MAFSNTTLALVVAAFGLAATACTKPIDVEFVNNCDVDVRLQTFDGEIDEATGDWLADPAALADVVVPANGRLKVEDAFMFVGYPEEVRILEPVQESYLISLTEDLESVSRGPDIWTTPLESRAS